jgi:hypothetical protein
MGIIIEEFSKGWQNKARQELMRDDALFVCTDIGLDRLGSLMARRLHVEQAFFDTQSYTSAIEDVYFVNVENADVYLVYFRVGSSLYCWNSSTTTTRTVSNSMSGGHVSYAPLRPVLSDYTYVFVTDGVVMLCDNGVTTKTWGIDEPTNLPIVSMAGSGGALNNGSYVYAYTFYDSNTGSESDPSVVSATTTAAADDQATITDIKTSPNSRVTKRRLYRTLVNGGTKYLVTTINDNVTTSYVDSKDDDNLTTELNTDQGVPPTGDIVIAHNERLFLSGDTNYPNRVWFSRSKLPDNFPSTYYLSVGTVNDKVLNMVRFEGKLYFIQRAGITGLYGSDADTYAWHQTRSHVGANARWSCAAGPDGIYFLGHDGVYRFDGLKSTRVSDPIDRTFGLSAGTWTEIIDTDTVEDDALGGFLFGKYYLKVPLKDDSGAVTSQLLVYDVFDETWLLQDVDPDSLFADNGRGKLYGSMARKDGSGYYTVYELFSADSSTEDSSTPTFVTKSFAIKESQEGRRVGWLRRFRVDCVGTWTLYFYVDGTLQHTEALTSESASTRYAWYDFPPDIKGQYFYVRGVGGGDPEPETTIFNSIEVETR